MLSVLWWGPIHKGFWRSVVWEIDCNTWCRGGRCPPVRPSVGMGGRHLSPPWPKATNRVRQTTLVTTIIVCSRTLGVSDPDAWQFIRGMQLGAFSAPRVEFRKWPSWILCLAGMHGLSSPCQRWLFGFAPNRRCRAARTLWVFLLGIVILRAA